MLPSHQGEAARSSRGVSARSRVVRGAPFAFCRRCYANYTRPGHEKVDAAHVSGPPRRRLAPACPHGVRARAQHAGGGARRSAAGRAKGGRNAAHHHARNPRAFRSLRAVLRAPSGRAPRPRPLPDRRGLRRPRTRRLHGLHPARPSAWLHASARDLQPRGLCGKGVGGKPHRASRGRARLHRGWTASDGRARVRRSRGPALEDVLRPACGAATGRGRSRSFSGISSGSRKRTCCAGGDAGERRSPSSCAAMTPGVRLPPGPPCRRAPAGAAILVHSMLVSGPCVPNSSESSGSRPCSHASEGFAVAAGSEVATCMTGTTMTTIATTTMTTTATGTEADQARSKRSRFITFVHAATKSWTSLSPPSELP